MTQASVCNAAELTHPRDRPMRERVGGGNLLVERAGAGLEGMYEALRGVGARSARMNAYDWRDGARRPAPQVFDAAMLQAWKERIRPVLLLEYYGSYATLSPPQPVGTYEDWYAAGRALARRFRPGGEWARENGAGDWGVEVIAAMNEPDVEVSIPHKAYHDALAGLADGIHSIDPAMRVVPGGFATCNSHGDATLRGYGPAIADLLESGRLDGIDLHTYYHDRFFPLTKGRFFSAQSCFDRVKQAMGLQRDVGFYSTEFQVNKDGTYSQPESLASLFLTALWDHLGVVGKDGANSATVIAFPWNLVNTGVKVERGYAMATQENPWRPDIRSQVLRRVMDLAGDMRFVSLDPRGTGRFELEGGGRRLYVWQNRPDWTDRAGREWRLELPPGRATAELWGWDGLRRRLDVEGGPLVLSGLPGGETYMLLLRAAAP